MEKIKIQEELLDIVSIKRAPNLLIIEFPKVIDLSQKDLKLIELFTAGDVKCADFEGYETIYKIDGNIATLSNDGSIYAEPEPPIEPEQFEPYVPTEVDIARQQISQLKSKLQETDYMIIKCSEYQLSGLDMPYDIAKLHAERQALRDQINELELSLS